MDDIERLCSRVLILRSGEMIYDGKPEGLTREGERRLRVRLVQRPSLEELSRTTGVDSKSIEMEAPSVEQSEEGEAQSESKSVHFNIKQDQIVSILQKLMASYQIVDMGIEEQGLETVIQRIYEEEKALT
jgi:ABC-type uncharacterized transport system ATPase subunit